MNSKPVLWFTAIFSLSLAVGLLAGKSVNASFQPTTPQAEVNPALPVETQPIPTQETAAWMEVRESEPPQPKSPSPTGEPSHETADPKPFQKFNQQNLLVVQVDSLRSSRPKLQSIWLAIYLPEMSQVMLLPLFPRLEEHSGAELEQALQSILALPMPVDEERNPHPKLLEALRATGIWWQHTMVFDHLAFIELLEAYGKDANLGEEGTPAFDPLQAVSALAAQSHQPEAFLKTSAWLYGQICPVWASGSGVNEGLRNIGEFSPSHLKSDLPPDLENSGAAHSGEQVNLICQFPSLAPRP